MRRAPVRAGCILNSLFTAIVCSVRKGRQDGIRQFFGGGVEWSLRRQFRAYSNRDGVDWYRPRVHHVRARHCARGDGVADLEP